VAFVVLAVKHEKSIGSVRFFIYFLLTNLLCNLTFIALTLIMSLLFKNLISDSFLVLPFYGLTPFLLVEIVIEANKSPNENKQ